MPLRPAANSKKKRRPLKNDKIDAEHICVLDPTEKPLASTHDPCKEVFTAATTEFCPYLSTPDATAPQPAQKTRIKSIELSKEQRQSAESIRELIEKKDYFTVLLYGATGSGKTVTYLDCACCALNTNEEGAQVLILTPEIGLIPQLKRQIQKILGINPVIWSSNSSIKNKKEDFSAIASGAAQIVIGTRSALMLPYKNLKLVVVDEEHDSSYKQENAPVYHARDMAVLRAQTEKIVAILCSATPSVETFYNAKRKDGKQNYRLVSLKARYCSQPPEITVVDMQKTGQTLNSKQLIAKETLQAIQNALQRGKQTLLLLNKRGFATIALCKKCSHAIHCRNCSVKMTVHKTAENMTLRCHQCEDCIMLHCVADIGDQTVRLTSEHAKCTKCGGTDNIIPYGPRIEQLQEEVIKAFPTAINIMISSDSKKKEEAFEKIRHNKVNIAIGTQILAKGHNFMNLGLVVIISGDVHSHAVDFRSNEKIYQLLHQTIGRSGRAEEQGRAFIQTYSAKSEFIQILASFSYDKFYENEILYRKKFGLPPFTRCLSITTENADEAFAKEDISEIHKGLVPFSEKIGVIREPETPAISKKRNLYRYQIVVFAKDYVAMQQTLKYLNEIIVKKEQKHADSAKRKSSGRQRQESCIKIDTNPLNFM